MRRNLVGRLGGLCRQVLHFTGDDGEPFPRIAGAGRFDDRADVDFDKAPVFGQHAPQIDDHVDFAGALGDEATGVANKQKWVGDYKQNKGTAELSVYVSGDKVTMVGIDGPGAKQWSAAGKIDGDKIVMDLSKPAPNNKEGAKPDGKEGVEMTRTKLGASFEGAEYSKVFYGPFVNRLLEVGYGY